MKVCRKCKIEKPYFEFYKDSTRKDGLRYRCKACTDSGAAAQQASYRAANRERLAEYYSNYRAANPEKCAEREKRWRAENPDKIAVNNRNRRAIKQKAEGEHAASDISRIFERQRGLCANCHIKLFKSGKQKFHVDHIIPLARGGSNWPSNIQCLCPSCNLAKHAKDPIEWARQNGRLL